MQQIRSNAQHPNRTSTSQYQRMREAVKRRDEYRCRVCGRGPDDGVRLEVDHVVPWTQGGDDVMDNLVTLCKPHHNEKTKQEAAERRGKRSYIPAPSVEWE